MYVVFDIDSQRHRLKKNAVPTIFPGFVYQLRNGVSSPRFLKIAR